MIKNFRGILGTWVFSLETNPVWPLGKVIDMVIDPWTGRGVALWVKTLNGLRLLDLRDLRKWNKKIYIPSSKDLVKPTEFPRVSAILEREVPIIGANVFIMGKKIQRRIGYVVDFTFLTEFPLILNLKVNKGWWIFGKRIEIPRKKILKITADGIFISYNFLRQNKTSDEKLGSEVVPSLD